MTKLVRTLLIVPTVAILSIASATVALADNGVNLIVDPTATLTAKVGIQATTTLRCPSGWLVQMAFVNVEQAVGKSIAHGTGNFNGIIQCDGTDHVITATVLADPSGPPFKKGAAVLSANIYAYDPATFQSGGAFPIVTIKVK